MSVTIELGALIATAGLIFTVFCWFYKLIGDAKREATSRADAAAALASVARDALASHKLHVAETYTTKAGMQEQTAQIMKALDGVSAKIDYTNGRLDTFTQLKPATTRSRAGS